MQDLVAGYGNDVVSSNNFSTFVYCFIKYDGGLPLLEVSGSK